MKLDFGDKLEWLWKELRSHLAFFVMGLFGKKSEEGDDDAGFAAGAMLREHIFQGECGVEGFTILASKLSPKKLWHYFERWYYNCPSRKREEIERALDRHFRALKDGVFPATVVEKTFKAIVERGKTKTPAGTEKRLRFPEGYEPEKLFVLFWKHTIERAEELGDNSILETAVDMMLSRSKLSLWWSSVVEWLSGCAPALREYSWSEGVEKVTGWSLKFFRRLWRGGLRTTIVAGVLGLGGFTALHAGYDSTGAMLFTLAAGAATVALAFLGIFLLALTWVLGGSLSRKQLGGIVLAGAGFVFLVGFVLLIPSSAPAWTIAPLVLFGFASLWALIRARSVGERGVLGTIFHTGFIVMLVVYFVPGRLTTAVVGSGTALVDSASVSLTEFNFDPRSPGDEPIPLVNVSEKPDGSLERMLIDYRFDPYTGKKIYAITPKKAEELEQQRQVREEERNRTEQVATAVVQSRVEAPTPAASSPVGKDVILDKSITLRRGEVSSTFRIAPPKYGPKQSWDVDAKVRGGCVAIYVDGERLPEIDCGAGDFFVIPSYVDSPKHLQYEAVSGQPTVHLQITKIS